MGSKIIPFPSVSGPRLVPAAPSTAPGTASRTVTFTRPFTLPGMNGPHAAGTFELRTTRHDLDVMHEAYHVTTRIMLVEGLSVEALDVTSTDLQAALALDAAPRE